MASGGTMARLALAALASAATAGLLLALFLAAASLLAGAPGRWSDLQPALLMLLVGIVGGLVVATLPAFFAGASLWALGGRFPIARLPHAWAAAGASVGGALWALFAAFTGAFHRGPGPLETILTAASLAAGAGGALAFRSAMHLTGGRPGPLR
jgi:hypothetical protein